MSQPDLKADHVLANPPFNQRDWRCELHMDDGHSQRRIPAESNADRAWVAAT